MKLVLIFFSNEFSAEELIPFILDCLKGLGSQTNPIFKV